jgi:1,5-anhydro-D-fructose reductase (1,5-anhydro-D-mannitol-forming)
MKQENTYVHTIRAIHDAIAGAGQPSATGEDGVRSLSVALAALHSTATHQMERAE